MNHRAGNRSWFLFILLTIITWSAGGKLQAVPVISVEPSPALFGSADLFDGFTTVALTVANTGDEALVFGPPGIVLTEDVGFSFIDEPSTTPLAAETSRTYVIKFDPVKMGSNRGYIRFYTNDPAYPQQTVTLDGYGLAAHVVVTADPLEFGHKVITEGPTRARLVTIRNGGTVPLEFTGDGISITGANAEDFGFSDPPSTTTLPINSTSSTPKLMVHFDPQSPGEKEAQLIITTNSDFQPTVTLELSGLGLAERSTVAYGPYDGYGPGESTIGAGGDYESLFDACMDVNELPLTGGDWTFRIVSDLFEEYNSYLGQPDTNGNLITFRPALNTSATVTFTTTTWARYSGESAEGHFLLGNHYNKRITPETPSVTISNVLIDGSQSPGGSDISLFFRRENLSGSCPVILVYGGCKNITLRNCNISTDVSGRPSYTPPFRTAAPVYIVTQRLTETENPAEYTSENILIEGCVLKVGGTYGTAAIWHDGPPSYPLNAYYRFASGTKNLIIQNNKLDTINLGISLICPTSAFVKNNYFKVTQGTSPNEGPVVSIGTDALRIYPGETSITVTKNIIEYQRGSAGTGSGAGIGIRNRSWPGTYHITNNIISGLEASSDPIKTRAGIIANGAQETTAVIAHNSIYIKASDILPSAGKCYGIGTDIPFWWTQNFFYPTEIDMFAHNNVVHVEQVGASAIHHEGTTGIFVSDNNDLSVVSGAYTSTWSQFGTNGWTENHATLDDRRTTTGQDMNSVSVNPFEPVSPGLGTWTRAGAGPDGGPAVADLHFSNYPGSVYLAPRIDGLDTDIDGDPRPEAMVIIGADEVPHHRSHVDGWGIY